MKQTMTAARYTLAGSLLAGAVGFATQANASEPFIGQITAVGFGFAPRGWATCDGQLLPISQYSAVFSLLGTTFGGDGRTSFGLPDLRGRSAVHVGSGPGLSNIRWGDRGGSETHTLTLAQMPPHSHAASTSVTATADTAVNSTATSTAISTLSSVSATLRAYEGRPNEKSALGNSLAVKGRSYSSNAPDVDMHSGSVVLSRRHRGHNSRHGDREHRDDDGDSRCHHHDRHCWWRSVLQHS